MPRISNPNDTPAIQPSQPVPSNGKTILIAEDDPFISRMYQTKLMQAGYAVVVKNNGRDAYEEIKRIRPSLTMLDINMPELTGFEVLNALQGDGYDFSTSPAIILTNSSRAEDLTLAKKFGVDYMIKAELTPRDVLERIAKKLGMKDGDKPTSDPAAAKDAAAKPPAEEPKK